MMRSRFSEQQIIATLKKGESGIPTKELTRKHGICAQPLYRWKSKYGGLDVQDAKKLKEL